MKTPLAARLALVCSTAALAWGCQRASPPPSATAPQSAAVPLSTSGPGRGSRPSDPGETIDVAALPVVDGAVPPLDDGRLTLNLPGDWYRFPRSKQYLLGAQLSRQAKYPALLVHVEGAGGVDDLAAEDLNDFAERVQAEFDEEQIKLAEPVKPVNIGPFAGVQYARGAKVDKLPLERLFLVTVAGGRRYTLELRAVHGELHKYRPWGWAVAASMRFGGNGE